MIRPNATYRQQYTLFACFLILLLLFPVSLIAQTYTQWGGAVSTSWNNFGNWNNGVPNATISAKISTPSYHAYVPVPSPDTARTEDLDIQHDGFLHFDSAGVLVVHGSTMWIQPGGTLYLGYGRVISKGNIRFYNAGDFNAESGTLEFAGVRWENKNNSTFIAGTSTVIFNGSSNQTLIVNDSLVTGITYYNLEIKTQDTVSILGDVTVTNSVFIAAGSTLNIPAGSSLNLSGGCTIVNNGTVTGGGTYPAALPVQVTSVTATANRLDATLRWATATEVNNFGFEIERRLVSGFTAWSRVGFVAGSGTSTSPKEYSFVDANLPAGRYGYRIKQIDFGGAWAYYDATEVEIGLAPKVLSLGSNYPNPFNPSTTIEFTLPQDGKASLKVFNMIGQEVATLFDQNAEAGKLYRSTFSAYNLPSGLYFYRIEFGNQSIVKRMTLVK